MKKNHSPFRHQISITGLLVLTGISFLAARGDGFEPISGNPGGPGKDQGTALIANGGNGAAGNSGVALSNATGANTNDAQVTGGQGGAGGRGGLLFGNGGNGGAGGNGFYLQSADNGVSLVNNGSITGGAGGLGGGTGMSGNGGTGGTGGAGLYLQLTGNDFSLVNTSSLTGSQGGAGGASGLIQGNAGSGGAGGAGLYLQSTGTGISLVNTGSIAGSQGGHGGVASIDNFTSPGGNGGNGGTGVYLNGPNVTFTNQGTVTGSAGGTGGTGGPLAPASKNGTAGLGVFFSGVGTLVNQGTISGGVQMANGANSVTLFTGSQITGGLNMGNTNTQTLILTGTGTQNFSDAVAGEIHFSGSLIKQGDGTWTLDRHLADSVTIGVQSGTLVMDGGSLGSSPSDVIIGDAPGAVGAATVTGTGTLLANVDATHALYVGNSGSGTLTIADGGIVRIGTDGNGALNVAALNNSSGTVNMGSADLVNPTTAGTLQAGSVVFGAGTGVLNFNQTDSTTFAPDISGTGSVVLRGTGTTILTGTNTYTGTTTIKAGSLLVNGSLGNTAVSVNNGGTLGGSGTIAGTVTVQGAGMLSPGNSPGTLTVGNLVLNSGALLNYQLDTPDVVGGGVNDLVVVTNNLTLNGVLNISPLTNFGNGTYTLFTYGGTLVDNGLTLGDVPGGYDLALNASGGVVTLTVSSTDLQYWNGSQTSADGTVHGGDGTWASGPTNWTDKEGNVSLPWGGNTAIFSGTAGTVTVSGTQEVKGLQFVTDGYTLTGGTLDGGSNNLEVRIDSGLSASVNSTITGTGGLTKTGLGTVVLGGTNTYTGGTRIGAGTLQIDSDANLGDASGNVTIDMGTLASTGDITTSRAITINASGTFNVASGTTFTANGMVSGAGNFTKEGDGAFVFGMAPAYTGGTTIDAGTLDTGNHDLTTLFLTGSGGTLALGIGNLTVNQNANTTFSGAITGTGGLTKNGDGRLTLAGTDSFTGAVDVEAGVLQADAPGALVDGSTYTVNGGTLDLNGHDLTAAALSGTGGTVNLGSATLTVSEGTYLGSIQGTYTNAALNNGTLNKVDSGTLTLGGTSNLGGPFQINAGVVDITSSGNLTAQYVVIDGTDAELTVEGTLTQSDSLNVGYMENGTVAISNGGSVSDLDGVLGQNFGQKGTVTVDGAGSSWTNRGAILIGQGNFAQGEVDITNGGVVSASAVFMASGAQSTGALTISGGGVLETRQLMKETAPGNTASVSIDGGTLRATGDSDQFVSGFAPGEVTLGTRGGTIDTNGYSVVVDSSIGGAGGLTKTGDGDVLFSAANSFSGAMTIERGSVTLGTVNAIAAMSQLKLAGGAFDANGFSPAAFSQALTVDGEGSALDFGAGHTDAVTLQFADSSGVNWSSDLMLLNFAVGTDALGFGTDVNGLTQAQLADIDLAGYQATGLDSNGFVEFELMQVPEPTVFDLASLGFAVLVISSWRRRRV